MPNRSPRLRQAHAARGGGSRNGSSRRGPATPATGRRRATPVTLRRSRRSVALLPRSSSEPALRTMTFASDGNGGLDDDDDGPQGMEILPRHYTCADVCRSASVASPSSPTSTEGSGGSSRNWEGKVVVTVTVEGSPGPVRAMARLGATVEEAIGAVVDVYRREGRSPKLDPAAVASFQLHHNHFCLQSLDKAATLGQVGGRSFYLRRSCAGSGGASSCRGSGAVAAASGGHGGARERSRPQPPVLLRTRRFLTIIMGRLSEVGRRLMKLWRVLACAACG